MVIEYIPLTVMCYCVTIPKLSGLKHFTISHDFMGQKFGQAIVGMTQLSLFDVCWTGMSKIHLYSHA